MVVERPRSFIESPGVPGIPEPLKVQVMAKFVTQSAQKSSKRSNLFLYRRFHPHADKDGVGIVVAEKLNRRSLPDAQRSRGKNPHVAMLHLIEVGGRVQKLSRESQNLFAPPRLHAHFDGRSNSAQSIVLGQP